jgi:hypothetical protein
VEGLTRGEFDETGAPDVATHPNDAGDAQTDAALDQGDTGDATTMETAFTGAGAYATNQPTTSAVSSHMTNNVMVTPGLGVDCLTCHTMGGTGAVFLFGGTVFQDTAGTMPAVDEEIRVLDSNNVGYSAHSDADGNFWYKATTTIAFPALSGVRNATQTVLMTTTLSAANCNGCHNKTTTDPLHIP